MAARGARRYPYLLSLIDVIFNRGSNSREMALRVRVFTAFLQSAAEAALPSSTPSPAEALLQWQVSFGEQPLLRLATAPLATGDMGADDFAQETLAQVLQCWFTTGTVEMLEEPSPDSSTGNSDSRNVASTDVAASGRRTTVGAPGPRRMTLASRLSSMSQQAKARRLSSSGNGATGLSLSAPPVDPPYYGCSVGVRNWSVAEVGSWLRRSGRHDLHDVFAKHGVAGPALMQMDSELLTELGLVDAKVVASLMSDILVLRDLEEGQSQAALAMAAAALVAPEVVLASEIARLLHSCWRRLPYAVGLMLRTLQDFLATALPKLPHSAVEQALLHFLLQHYLRPVYEQLVSQRKADRTRPLFASADLAIKLLLRAGELGADNTASSDHLWSTLDGVPVSQDVQRHYQRFFTQSVPPLRATVRRLLRVASLDEHFGIEEYGDVTAIAAPTVYITPGDLLNLHQMLVSWGNARAVIEKRIF